MDQGHPVDAVIFDMDGVIVDSEPVWDAVRRDFVRERDGRWVPDSHRQMMGMSTAEWSRYMATELGVPMPAEAIAAEVIDRMATRYAAALPLIPGAPEAIGRIAARWPLGLASSSPPSLIETVLRRAAIAGLFQVTISTEEVPRGKPAPDVYLAACERLGVGPARCVAAEDSSNGVHAAAAAGMRVVAVPRPEHPLDNDAEQESAVVLSGVQDLKPMLIDQLM
jgi:HAD superfamily hydrolase (TIGR01509 family)